MCASSKNTRNGARWDSKVVELVPIMRCAHVVVDAVDVIAPFQRTVSREQDTLQDGVRHGANPSPRGIVFKLC